jgi:hypothetical protein
MELELEILLFFDIFLILFTLSSLRPVLSSEDDTSQFDSNFTKQTPVDSPCGASLSESVNLVFQVGRISYLLVSKDSHYTDRILLQLCVTTELNWSNLFLTQKFIYCLGTV